MNVKKRDGEATKQKIIEIAKVLFANQGYQSTTLSQIGKQCGLSRTTPSYFFENKESLYRAVIEELIKEEKSFVSYLSYDGPITVPVLKELFNKYMRYTFENPYLCKIIIRESLSSNKLVDISEMLLETNWYTDLIQRAIDSGVINKKVDAQFLRYNGMVMTWMPIITNETFMKTANVDIMSSDFFAFYASQVESIIFDSILKD